MQKPHEGVCQKVTMHDVVVSESQRLKSSYYAGMHDSDLALSPALSAVVA